MSRSGWACPTTHAPGQRSFDRIFLVHVYHEVTEPYEFLWHLRDGLKPDGLIIVVDADRPVKRHGMPPRQLIVRICGARPAAGQDRAAAGSDAYFMAFRIAGARPEPGAIKPCRLQGLEQPHPPHAAAFAPGEDQMIEDGEVDRLGGPGQSARGAIVGLARPGIAARVVVGEDQAGAAEPERVGDDVAHRQPDRGRLALILLDMEAARWRCRHGPPQLLVRLDLRPEASGEEAARGFVAVEERR